MSSTNEKIERAIRAFLSTNRDYKGRQPTYHVAVLEGASDGSQFGLTIGLASGQTYCCSEWGCHFGLARTRDWARLRSCLQESGLSPDVPIQISPFRWTIDERVVVEMPGIAPMKSNRLMSFELDPLLELEAKEL